MEQLQVLEKIETENAKVEELRSKLPIIKKIALHTGLEGFTSPQVFGVFKSTGGDCLSVCKDSYRPANLSMFLDTIVNSVTESGLDLDIDKIEYREYKGGKKVSFRLPLKDFEIESPMKDDILKSSLLFSTGFDCLTLSKLTYSTLRVWCSNGRAAWDKGVSLAYKNTKNNADKYLLFTEQIIKTSQNVEDYVKYLGDLAKRQVTQEQLDDFYMRLIGVNRANYLESHKKSQAIFDTINNAVLVESNNTGMNLFSLNQAITRYSTHELASIEEDVYFGNASKFTQFAEQVALSLN